MSEIIQIPNDLNLQLSTLLFGQNQNFESGKFTLEDLKNFLDDYFLTSNNGGGGNATIHVGQIPPESAIDGTKWIETDETGIFINEWTYAWLDSKYRWIGHICSHPVTNGFNTANLMFSILFDYYIQSYTTYFKFASGSALSNYSFTTRLISGSFSDTSNDRIISEIRYESPIMGNLYSDYRIINEILSPKFEGNSEADSSQILGLRGVGTASGISGSVFTYGSVNYALVRKELEE